MLDAISRCSCCWDSSLAGPSRPSPPATHRVSGPRARRPRRGIARRRLTLHRATTRTPVAMPGRPIQRPRRVPRVNRNSSEGSRDRHHRRLQAQYRHHRARRRAVHGDRHQPRQGRVPRQGGASKAHDADDYIIYNKSNGRLYYDADGKDGLAAQHFATLSTHTSLDRGDFAIV